MARLEAAASRAGERPGLPPEVTGDLAARVAAALAKIDRALAGEG